MTGDELLHSGPPRPGRVRDAIGPMLTGLRADLLGVAHVADDPAALLGALTGTFTAHPTDAPATPLATRTTGHADDPISLTGALMAAPAHSTDAPISRSADTVADTPSSHPADPTQPADPTRPDHPADPTHPADPAHPADRADPTHLADSAHPADLLIACGATSVGTKDHLHRVLQDLGAEILVSGVACRPGHPQLLAKLPDGRCVVGLPGNPFAALAAIVPLLHPLLDTLGGHTTPPPITAHLANVKPHPRDTLLVPVSRQGGEATPVGHDRPGSLWGAARADALAVVPPGHDHEEVELLTERNGTAS